MFEKIFVPVEVEKEIMKLYESSEAVQLRDAIREGWVEVEQPSEDKKRQIAKLFSEKRDGEG